MATSLVSEATYESANVCYHSVNVGFLQECSHMAKRRHPISAIGWRRLEEQR